MHPEKWGSAVLEWRDPILGCPWAQAYVDEHFRGLWGWKGRVWTSLESPLMQLAISDPSYLSRIAAFAGALVAVKEIRKAVDRKTVLELRKGLGEDVLNFAYNAALRFRINIPQKCQLQQWPGSDDGSSAATVLNSGWLLIACACALLPVEEWNRFRSRLPRSVEKDFGQRKFSSEDSKLAWWCLKELLRVAMQEEEG
jgi:YOP proteins translocation protein K (YscK)